MRYEIPIWQGYFKINQKKECKLSLKDDYVR